MCLTVCAFCALDSLQVSSPTSKRRSWPCLCRQRNLGPLQCIRQRGLTGLLPLMNPLLAKEDPEALEYVGVVENLRVEAGQTHTAAGPSSRRRPLRHALIRVIIKQVAISLAQGLQVVVRRRFQLRLMNERRVVGPLLRPPRRTSAYRLDRQWLLEIIVSLRTWAVYLTLRRSMLLFASFRVRGDSEMEDRSGRLPLVRVHRTRSACLLQRGDPSMSPQHDECGLRGRMGCYDPTLHSATAVHRRLTNKPTLFLCHRRKRILPLPLVKALLPPDKRQFKRSTISSRSLGSAIEVIPLFLLQSRLRKEKGRQVK